jgi:hypothetical protein
MLAQLSLDAGRIPNQDNRVGELPRGSNRAFNIGDGSIVTT